MHASKARIRSHLGSNIGLAHLNSSRSAAPTQVIAMSEPAAQPAKRVRLHGKQSVQETCPPTAPGAEDPAAVREVYLVTLPHPERPRREMSQDVKQGHRPSLGR